MVPGRLTVGSVGGPMSARRLQPPRPDRDHAPGAGRRLRGVHEDRQSLVTPARLPHLRQGRLLRLVAEQARERATRPRPGIRSCARPSRARPGAGATSTTSPSRSTSAAALRRRAARQLSARSTSSRSSGPGGGSSRYGRYLSTSASSPAGAGVELEHLDPAEQLHPGELRPVVVVDVDAERRLRVAAQPADSGGLGGPLRLAVDRAPDRALGEREGDRQHPRPVVVVEEGEPRDPARLE